MVGNAKSFHAFFIRFQGFGSSTTRSGMEHEPHIGQLIKAELTRQGRSVAWLAGCLCCHRNNVYLIFRRAWIDTFVLKKISIALHHDFFADLSDDYLKTLDDNDRLSDDAK